MKGPAYFSQPSIQRLPVLLQEIRDGHIRIPRFQRPFVWTPDQRLLLFESIYQGMPIGSILVWRTREHDLKSYEKLGPLPLQREPRVQRKAEEVRQYLLDGHQRLTTLYAALGEGLLSAEGAEEGATEGACVSTGTNAAEENWPVYFDLQDRSFQLWGKRGEVPRTWLPLSILYDPFKLYEFQKNLLEETGDRGLMNRAEALASTFKDYSIPVVPFVGDDLERVTESFQRINSAGTRMDQVHMASALTWSPDFDLNEKMEEIQGELAEVGWEDLEEKMILNTCKAALGLDIGRPETKAIQKELRKNNEILTEATHYLKQAADFLRRRCKVYGPGTLPYSFQVVLLADAIRLSRGRSAAELAPELSDAFQRWFWLTTYTEYFASMSTTRLRKALEHLRSVVVQGNDPMPPDLPSKVGAMRRFDFRAARSRAIVLRIAELGPRNPKSKTLDPYQLLAEHGRTAAPMLIPSRQVGDRTAAEGAENRIIVHPREATQLRRLLLEEIRSCDREILRSHAIEEDAAAVLAAGDIAQFLTLRRERLIEIERSFVEKLGLEYVVEFGDGADR